MQTHTFTEYVPEVVPTNILSLASDASANATGDPQRMWALHDETKALHVRTVVVTDADASPALSVGVDIDALEQRFDRAEVDELATRRARKAAHVVRRAYQLSAKAAA